jgi:hypothetical protein
MRWPFTSLAGTVHKGPEKHEGKRKWGTIGTMMIFKPTEVQKKALILLKGGPNIFSCSAVPDPARLLWDVYLLSCNK